MIFKDKIHLIDGAGDNIVEKKEDVADLMNLVNKADTGSNKSESNTAEENTIGETDFEDEDIFENEYEPPDDGKEPDKKISEFGKMIERNKIKLILSVFIVLAAVTAIAFTGKYSKTEKPKEEITTQEENLKEKEVIPEVDKTPWGTKSSLDYTEYVEESEKLYTDSMVVTKFVLEDEASVIYYFSGIPKNFKRKVVFPVSLEEYNSVSSGGKIFLDYKIFNKDGVDRITDVSTNVEERGNG